MTRRTSTWIVVAAVLAIATAGLADSLRGSGPATSTTTTKARAAPTRPALRGVLYYTDENCVLRGMELVSRGPAEAPPGATECRFAISPRADTATAPGADWGPDEITIAGASAGSVTVVRGSTPGFEFPGSVPAFQPNGWLTYVRKGAVLTLQVDCARAFYLEGDSRAIRTRCSEVLLTRADVRRAALQDPFLPSVHEAGRISITELAWITSSRAVAIVEIRLRAGFRQSLVVIFEDRSAERVLPLPDERVSTLKVSPFRLHFGFLVDGRLRLYTNEGTALAVPSTLPAVRGFDFSPDDRSIVAATTAGVFVFPTQGGARGITRIGVTAADVAWRAH